MTETAIVSDAGIAERLARLESRRSDARPTSSAPAVEDADTAGDLDMANDTALTERLARLQARRNGARPTSPDASTTDTHTSDLPADLDIANDTALTERLARLQARRSSDRSGVTPGSTSPVDAVGAATVPGSANAAARSIDGDVAPRPVTKDSDRAPRPVSRRRSPAATAKIVTVGASTTAVLGLIAGYGYADGRSQGPAPGEAPIVPAQPITSGRVPVAPAAASTPPSPQVVVVLVDQTTGQQLGAVTGGSREQAVGQALELVRGLESADPTVVPPAPASADPATAVAVDAAEVVVADPAPVTAPPAVDLAVPAPPPPPTPQAPAVATADPAPAPDATSGGS